jgi:hypothetical protein
LFDNLKPNLPVLPINLDSDKSSISVLGTALFSKEIIVADKSGRTIEKKQKFQVSEDGTFNFDMNLVAGVNFFKFAAVGHNGLVSDFVERVIISKPNSVINFEPFVSNINLDDNNLLNKVVSGVTLKRNIYVSGNIGYPDSRVFISGNPVVSTKNGDFGGFVNLNQGENKIEVLAGGKNKSFDVSYVSEEFRFRTVQVSKFTNVDNVNLNIEALYDANFDVYLNGEITSTQKTSNGVLDLKVSDLRYGKNYIYLSGPSGKFIEKLVFYDNQKPEIEVVSPQNSSALNRFIFEVLDDFGFDIKKTVFKLNGITVSNDNLTVSGNYFVYDVSELTNVDNSYSILVYDLAGNSSEEFGNFTVSSDSVSLDEITVNDGKVLGNRIFFNSLGTQNLKIIPSKNIAFEEILLDGEDQTNYSINNDNSVDLEVNLFDKSGEFEFIFIDGSKDIATEDLNNFTQKFSYIVVSEPKIEFDFIPRSILGEGETFVVSGKVTSEYFNWNSFEINSVDVKRKGDYFETHLTFDGSLPLLISGNDFLGKHFSDNTVDIVKMDSSDLNLQILNGSNDFFSGSIPDPFDPDVLGFVNSYDGVYSKQVLPQSFNLVSAQRSGLRNLNLKGTKESLKRFSYEDKVSVDGLKPEIYFLEDKVVVLGTLSEVKLISVNGKDFGTGEGCDYLYGFSNFCNEIDLVDMGDKVKVVDSFGNEFSRVYSGVLDDVSFPVRDLKIYFTGNDKYVDSRDTFVQGQFISSERIDSISTNYGSCEFDTFNFVCDLILYNGENNVDVEIKTKSGDTEKEEIILDVIPGPEDDGDSGSYVPLSLSLIKIYGDGVYDLSKNYGFDSTKVSFEGDVNKNSDVELIINDEVVRVNEFDDRVNFSDVDLSDFVVGSDKAQLDVWLRATDSFDRHKDSNVLILFYNRVKKTVVDVIIN